MPHRRDPVGRRGVPGWRDRVGWEQWLSDWCARRVARAPATPAARIAGAALAVVAAVRLPAVRANLGRGGEADRIDGVLADPERTGGPLGRSINSVLRLPPGPGEYRLGARRQTLRRKVRAAERAGVTWRRVEELDEQIALVALAGERERTHPLPQHRYPDPQLDDLPAVRLWLLAVDADGRPLVLSVTPVDRLWAALRYFRSFEDGPAASAARYLLTEVLVEQLVARGVRFLSDASSPFGLAAGVREYQRMLGWRLMRVRVRR